jgi:pimeloyl-ACP methyl ester carboxylesterase
MMQRISPVAKKALRRRDGWASREEMFAYFREKEFFCRMDDDALWDYVNAVALEGGDDDVRLAYSKEWEARVFLTVHDPYAALRQLQQPMLALRGERSDTIRPDVWQRWRDSDRHPAHRFVEVAGTGHLLPLEQPLTVADEVRGFLTDQGM